MKNNIAIIISGPSGVGKTTIINELIKITNWELYKSITTRPARTHFDYLEYDFVSVDEFKCKIHNNEFLEYAEVYGNYYGKPNFKQELKHNIILNIDVHGAMTLMEKLNIPFVSIFLSPPSINVLQKRLMHRNHTLDNNYTTRINAAINEIEYASKFDYTIINDVLENTIARIISIISQN